MVAANFSVAPQIEATLGSTTLIVQCASCFAELVGQSNGEVTIELARNYSLPLLAGRVNERPFCEACYEANAPKHKDCY